MNNYPKRTVYKIFKENKNGDLAEHSVHNTMEDANHELSSIKGNVYARIEKREEECVNTHWLPVKIDVIKEN